MKKLKTVNIKGKSYVEVHERLRYFRLNYHLYTIDTQTVEKTEDTIFFKAVILNEEGRLIASGHAEERRGSSFINKTSYVENCETSAWGRALGNFGIGLDTSVASAEEVNNAILNEKKDPVKKTSVSLEIGDSNWDKVLNYVANNKSLGLPVVIKNLEVKYSIKSVVKKEISKYIKL